MKRKNTNTPAGMRENGIEIDECGCCGAYHRVAFRGDCRCDNERFFDPEDAENRLGPATIITK